MFRQAQHDTAFEAADFLEFFSSSVPAFLRDTVLLMKTLFLATAALLCTLPSAQSKPADEQLRAIYNEEWKWRLEQFPGLEGPTSRFRIISQKKILRRRICGCVIGKMC
jgi:preprotein translocase subunit SecG